MESSPATERNSSRLQNNDKSYEPVTETNDEVDDRVTESNEEHSDESQEKLLNDFDLDSIAPDGGWGWMVCFASFLINVIVDGTFFSFGILLIDLLDFFHETRAKTAWVGSTLLGMSMIMGPVVSFLLKYFSCRQMVISGTLLTVASFISSVFSPTVDILILTYGFIGGIGMGMIFIPAIIIVGLYFNKKRAIATGIATSGAGVGVFVYGYLCDYLLEEYDWRGTILILSGLLLNCVVCGVVFRPVVEQKLKRRLRYLKENEALGVQHNCNLGSSGSLENADLALRTNGVITSLEDSELPLKTNGMTRPEVQNGLSGAPEKRDELISQFFTKQSRLYKSAQHLPYAGDQALDVSPRLLSTSCHVIHDHAQLLGQSNIESNTAIQHIRHGLSRPMMRKDIYYSGSVQQLPDYKQCGNITSFLARMTRESSEVETDTTVRRTSRSCWDAVIDKTNIWLFKDPIFVLLIVVFAMWTGQWSTCLQHTSVLWSSLVISHPCPFSSPEQVSLNRHPCPLL
ncbi:monocarboxylate transporter 7-like [Gigantopelta aegis]|uniref:monocarboxylate transporter 7-like n=1 Tax=Gigantopelta aegis TaxID=1735272 RepID=UPI001B88E18E|nr:monocarboxylate transporter 7-like [Gigantopelta aegis]